MNTILKFSEVFYFHFLLTEHKVVGAVHFTFLRRDSRFSKNWSVSETAEDFGTGSDEGTG